MLHKSHNIIRQSPIELICQSVGLLFKYKRPRFGSNCMNCMSSHCTGPSSARSRQRCDDSTFRRHTVHGITRGSGWQVNGGTIKVEGCNEHGAPIRVEIFDGRGAHIRKEGDALGRAYAFHLQCRHEYKIQPSSLPCLYHGDVVWKECLSKNLVC